MSNAITLILLLIAFVFTKDEKVLYVKHKLHDLIVSLFNKIVTKKSQTN